MKWYVLQVITGQEDHVQDELTRKGVHSVVCRELRVLRSGGKWLEREYVVIPSYVFIEVEITAPLYYVLKGITGVIKILGEGGRPSPLLPDEELWVQGCERAYEPSQVHFARDGTYEVINGPLSGQLVKILKIDRHRRRAKVEINILGRPQVTYLSFEGLKDI